MPKTITMRVDDDFYEMIRTVAKGEKRSISSFLEYSAMFYINNSTFVSDKEMKDILKDEELVNSLKIGKQEIENGEYEIIG